MRKRVRALSNFPTFPCKQASRQTKKIGNFFLSVIALKIATRISLEWDESRRRKCNVFFHSCVCECDSLTLSLLTIVENFLLNCFLNLILFSFSNYSLCDSSVCRVKKYPKIKSTLEICVWMWCERERRKRVFGTKSASLVAWFSFAAS